MPLRRILDRIVSEIYQFHRPLPPDKLYDITNVVEGELRSIAGRSLENAEFAYVSLDLYSRSVAVKVILAPLIRVGELLFVLSPEDSINLVTDRGEKEYFTTFGYTTVGAVLILNRSPLEVRRGAHLSGLTFVFPEENMALWILDSVSEYFAPVTVAKCSVMKWRKLGMEFFYYLYADTGLTDNLETVARRLSEGRPEGNVFKAWYYRGRVDTSVFWPNMWKLLGQ